MSFLRRKWPKKLERRKPENAETRKQFDAQQRSRAQTRAQYAQDVTDENEQRVAQVEAAVRSLTSRLRKGEN